MDVHCVVGESEAGWREDAWGGGSPAVRSWGVGERAGASGRGSEAQGGQRTPTLGERSWGGLRPPTPGERGQGGPESPDPGGEEQWGDPRAPTPGERGQGSGEAAQDSPCSREHLGFCRVGRGRCREGGQDAGSV